MSNATLTHIDEVLAYFNENGETETLQHFGISTETLRRYERKKKFFETKQPKSKNRTEYSLGLPEYLFFIGTTLKTINFV
jgi:hypothetical protein